METDSQTPTSLITPGTDALSVSFGKGRGSAPIVRRGLEDQASGTCGNTWRQNITNEKSAILTGLIRKNGSKKSVAIV
jgi:hypothetical protein